MSERPIPDRQCVIRRLVELPSEIEVAEVDLIKVQKMLAKAQDALKAKEIELQTSARDDGSPVIDGKNAEVRAAQLRQMTKVQREEVSLYENSLPDYRRVLTRKQNEFAAYRAIARLMGGAE